MTDKDIARSIMNLGFWNFYGEFDMVSAMKRAFVAMDGGYLRVDELIHIVKDEVDKKRFKDMCLNSDALTWIDEKYGGWFE